MNQEMDLCKNFEEILFSKAIHETLSFAHGNGLFNQFKLLFYSAVYTYMYKKGMDYDCLLASMIRDKISSTMVTDYQEEPYIFPHYPSLFRMYLKYELTIISGLVRKDEGKLDITFDMIQEMVDFIKSNHMTELMFK